MTTEPRRLSATIENEETQTRGIAVVWPGLRVGLRSVAIAAAFYYVTSLVVMVAVLESGFFELCRLHPDSAMHSTSFSGMTAWDGKWYARIASEGYSYAPDRMSNVAFFPAYPMLAKGLAESTGCSIEVALVVVAQIALLGVFVALLFYAQDRQGATRESVEWTLLAFGLFPVNFFFRMGYSESLFLLTVLMAMYGMRRNWPPLSIACLIGLSLATRIVGVALLPVFVWHLWQNSPNRLSFCLRSVVSLPLALWGLVAYMAFLYSAFGDPLVFIKAQQLWVVRPTTNLENLVGIASLRPIWEVYTPGSFSYWGRKPPNDPLFSMYFWNPIVFLGAIALVAYGAWKRWLTTPEVLLSAGLLLIPYVTQGMRMGMTSHARYASAAFPIYIVIAHLLLTLPPIMRALLCSLSAVMLAIFSALFVSWYFII